MSPRLGYGTFQMSLMKEFQQRIIYETQVNALATDSFSPYFQYGLGISTDLTELTRVGTFIERGSTGGRVAYEDYSGEIRVDNLVNYTAFGFLINTRKPLGNSGISVMGGIEVNGFLSRLRMLSYSRIYDTRDSSESDFNSFGFGVKPYIGLQRPFFNMPVELSAGYLAGMNGPFHLPGQQDSYLTLNNSDKKLKPDWNGLRINLTISVPIMK